MGALLTDAGCYGIRKVGLTADPLIPQTALVVEAVKKDQEGDAAAALSLYCKALDFFVPALHCEAQTILVTWVQKGLECSQAPFSELGVEDLEDQSGTWCLRIAEGLLWGRGSNTASSYASFTFCR